MTGAPHATLHRTASTPTVPRIRWQLLATPLRTARPRAAPERDAPAALRCLSTLLPSPAPLPLSTTSFF